MANYRKTVRKYREKVRKAPRLTIRRTENANLAGLDPNFWWGDKK